MDKKFYVMISILIIVVVIVGAVYFSFNKPELELSEPEGDIEENSDGTNADEEDFQPENISPTFDSSINSTDSTTPEEPSLDPTADSGDSIEPEEPVIEDEDPAKEEPVETVDVPFSQPGNSTVQVEPDWKINGIVETITTLSVSTLGGRGETYVIYYPESDYNCFLIVTFDLTAEDTAEPLDVRDIILRIDESDIYYPIGITRVAGDQFRGTITNNLSYLTVEYQIDDSSGSTTLNTADPLSFIYVVPLQELDGKRDYSLSVGISGIRNYFGIEPSDFFQGYVSVSTDAKYVGVLRADTSYIFEASSSQPSQVTYLGKLPYSNHQFYSETPTTTTSGNSIILSKTVNDLNVYIDDNDSPLWTKTFEEGIDCFDISSDGSTIAVVSENRPGSSSVVSIHLLNAQTGDEIMVLKPTIMIAEFTSGDAVSISSDGRFVSLITATGSLYVFDAFTGSQISKIDGPFSYDGSLSISNNGAYVGATYVSSKKVTRGYDYFTRTYMFKEGDDKIVWESSGSDLYSSRVNLKVLSLFSADSNVFLVSTNSRLTLFDSETGTELFSSNETFSSAINSVAISHDGSYVVVGCEDETVYLFNKSGKIIWSYKNLGSQVAASDDFKTIAIASKTSISFLDLEGNITWKYSFP